MKNLILVKNVIKHMTVTPMITHVFPLSDGARHEMKGCRLQGAAIPSDKNSSSFLHGGISLSYTF